MRRQLTFRSVCMTLLWIAVAITFGRQCAMSEVSSTVQRLDQRVRDLEQRPPLRITVDSDGKAVVDATDSNDSRRDGRDADERPVDGER